MVEEHRKIAVGLCSADARRTRRLQGIGRQHPRALNPDRYQVSLVEYPGMALACLRRRQWRGNGRPRRSRSLTRHRKSRWSRSGGRFVLLMTTQQEACK